MYDQVVPCPHCEATFYLLDDLYDHVLEKHGEKHGDYQKRLHPD